MSTAAPFPSQPPYGGASGTSGSRPTSSSNNPKGAPRERVFAHIDDLKQKALGGFRRDGSITQLLADAELALNQSQNMLNMFKRPDMAWTEYMRAAEIVVDALPRHRQWADLQMDHGGGLLPKYRLLQKMVISHDEQFRVIKEVIVENNRRSGVQRAGSGQQPAPVGAPIPQINGHHINGGPVPPKVKPVPSPKPESMHGNAITVASAGDALKDRLAKLRSTEAPIDTSRPDSRGSTDSSIHSSPTSVSMPESGGRASLDALSRNLQWTTMGATNRPQGPRGMPGVNGGPPIPGKLPLNTAIASMPQEPKATYSPARNMQAPGNIELPRQTPRSQFSTSSRKSSMIVSSSASSHAPNRDGGSLESVEYFPPLTRPRSNVNGMQPGQLARPRSETGPETSISAQRLYDFLERFNILLIDFRSRLEFDAGHIHHRSIVCIDPIHVTDGMSADDLLERMVISPDIEQEMFANRDKYDLVVYYDAQTLNESFLTRPTTELAAKLRSLYQALHEYSHDKVLQRPPILLIGGLDAWSDLAGVQALATSDTASRAKQGRPLQRRPVGGPLQLPRRRLREYNPLDDSEAQKWIERARAESVVLQAPPAIPEDGEGSEQDGEEDPNSAIEEFNQRFPDAGDLDRIAFGPLRPTRSAPQPPPKIPPVPQYPAAIPASIYPTVPTRPQPAAPRPSYTGVADRAGSQNVPAARSSTVVPYIPAKYLSSAFKIPRTGLHNFRFTCYMNATLQALSATKPLSIYFMEEGFKKQLQPDNWKGTRGILPTFYSTLIRNLWNNEVSYIKPTTFRQFCGRHKRDWMDDSREHDAKEFYDFLIDFLHEDLNERWSHPPDKPLTPAEEARRERMPPLVVAQIEWAKHLKRNQSFPASLFAGQYSSHLRFPQCGHTSTSHETFFALSVEIPDIRGRPITLDDCLRSFCKEENLEEEEWAKCEQCNERKETRKRITLTRAPQVLVLHFKRFSAERRRQHKIATPINFPLDNLDMGPYMLPRPSNKEADIIANQYSPAYLSGDPGVNPPYTYSAYAIVRHHGTTIESGHYTALVRDLGRPTWRCFNDSTHQDFQPGQPGWSGDKAVTNGQAYIVFYQRNSPVPANVNPAPIGPGGVGKI